MQEGQAEAELEELAWSTLERNNGDAEAAAAELGSKLLLHDETEYARGVLEVSGLDEAAAPQLVTPSLGGDSK